MSFRIYQNNIFRWEEAGTYMYQSLFMVEGIGGEVESRERESIQLWKQFFRETKKERSLKILIAMN